MMNYISSSTAVYSEFVENMQPETWSEVMSFHKKLQNKKELPLHILRQWKYQKKFQVRHSLDAKCMEIHETCPAPLTNGQIRFKRVKKKKKKNPYLFSF